MSSEGVYQDGDYFETRFPHDKQKNVVWGAVGNFLESRYGLDGTVVDVGAGYGYFLNGVDSARRVAVDHSAVPFSQVDAGVECVVGDATDLPLPDDTADAIMLSNVLEHLTVEDIQAALRECRRVLCSDGTLFVVTPNFALAPRKYYHDFTHETALTHRSVADLLALSGLDERDRIVRFLPFSTNSRVPVVTGLVRLYLALPIGPFAGQSLFVATPADGSGRRTETNE